MIAAVVQLSDLIVINVIAADASIDPPPIGCELIDITDGPQCGIGWLYDPSIGTFSDPSI